jgi:hypothetical protein
VLAVSAAAGETEWFDSFYTFRVPVTVSAPEPGPCVVEIDPAQITEWVNEKARFPFQPECFAFDNVKLVEIAEDGSQRPVKGGFRIQVGRELIANGGFEEFEGDVPAGWKIGVRQGYQVVTEPDGNHVLVVEGADRNGWAQEIETRLNTWYRLAWRSKGSNRPQAMIKRKTEPNMWWQPVSHSFADPAPTMRTWRAGQYYFYTGRPGTDHEDMACGAVLLLHGRQIELASGARQRAHRAKYGRRGRRFIAAVPGGVRCREQRFGYQPLLPLLLAAGRPDAHAAKRDNRQLPRQNAGDHAGWAD